MRTGAQTRQTRSGGPVNPLITRDPVSGGELLVTRLEAPQSGLVIEGTFSMGWVGRLTPEQLEFVGHLVRNRGNVQKVAAELNIAYNTARNRLDDIVAALNMPDAASAVASAEQERERRTKVLRRLSMGEIEFDEAMRILEQ
jgi:hypothetical protein